MGTKIVADALRAAGEHVEVMTDHFDDDTPDAKWLAAVGARGWIVLSKDRHLKHNLIEVVALLQSRTHSFILTSANCTGPEMASAFVSALPDIKRMIAKFPPPLASTITKAGKVAVAFTADHLIERVAERRDKS